MIYALFIGLVAGQVKVEPDTTTDPAFKTMSQLVGGNWVGTLGKMNIKFTFTFKEVGHLLEGEGTLKQADKVILNMDSKYGWDPAAKQTYYLDCHGYNTVYNGHITQKGEKLIVDFVGLIGDKGHWISYIEFPTKDTYKFDMFEVKKGKLVPTHMGVTLHRQA